MSLLWWYAARCLPAQLLLYDGFNYTPGELLAPTTDVPGSPNPGQLNVDYGLNWRYAGAGGTNTNPPSITSGNLSYTGLPASTGNSVAYDTSQIGSSRIAIPGGPYTGTADASATIYWSGLLDVTSVGSLTTGASGMLLAHLNNSTGNGSLPTVVGGELKIKSDGAGNYLIGTGVNNNSAALVFSSTAYQPNQTNFVVVSYTSVLGASNDVVKMWINPSAASFGAESPPTETLFADTSVSSTELSSIYSLDLRDVNTVGSPTALFDELRIGTTWASVTPAASTGGVPGDYNGNGVVDEADYVLWRNGGPLLNEVSSLGTVDQSDYDAWRAAFGNTSGSGSGLGSEAVPEPTSLSLVILGSLLLKSRRRKSTGADNGRS